MPINRKFKDHVRSVADERGIKYTSALREVEDGMRKQAINHGCFLSFKIGGAPMFTPANISELTFKSEKARMFIPANLSESFLSEGGLFDSGFDDIDICASYADDYLFTAAVEDGSSLIIASEDGSRDNDVVLIDGSVHKSSFVVETIPSAGILTEDDPDEEYESSAEQSLIDLTTFRRLRWAFGVSVGLMNDNGMIDESKIPELHQKLAERG